MSWPTLEVLGPEAGLLAVAMTIDLAIGDPAYAWHPVRLVGATLTRGEAWLRRIGANGHVGGVLLFGGLAGFWLAVVAGVVLGAAAWTPVGAWLVRLFVVYSLLALGDLLRHVWRVERAVARGDIPGARIAIGYLVGRDTAPMDGPACRRAAIESLSENLTDGFTSPIFWYALAGVPGLVLFKVVSTMDSMVGYKTPRYLEFGWCGARLDDLMNYLPARLTWLIVAAVALVTPGASATKALDVGRNQHALLPGPNSGWSEAAVAGAVQRRLVGPIWMGGRLVTEAWLGDPADPPLSTHEEVVLSIRLVTTAGLLAATLAIGALLLV
jgi:adenosylcobinamide-phosphate synthase